MIYLLVPCLIALAIIRHFLPVRWGVHAARANKSIGRGRFVAAGPITDEDGHRVSLRGKFLGKVEGDSMVKYGLQDGVTFIAEVLDEAARKSLQTGDIVVVDGVHTQSNSGLRLRCVAGVNRDGTVSFSNHVDGKKHKARADEKVKARVDYVFA